MLDESVTIEKREARVYDPIPPNMYQVELVDISSEERPVYQKPEEKETVLSFQFAILSGKDKEGNDLRTRRVWENFVPTYLYISPKNGKNKLYRVTEALLGHELSPEEEAYIDSKFLNDLIGKQCRIVTKNKPGKEAGKVFSVIESYLYSEKDGKALTDEEKSPKDEKKNEEIPETNKDVEEIKIEDIPF